MGSRSRLLIYTRVCRKCGEFYKTPGRFSTCCVDCDDRLYARSRRDYKIKAKLNEEKEIVRLG